ncbi:endonuclease V [Pyrococcus kukulkanii]|uniref:Endonuclease V n=1 Tax=Pyrococcus kukulkanii TaxID=1609559 RepID=A0A127B9J0_9EURY|nr:endonuclease V [Pyrococcus kukulkanii]AMM53867.1 endonuclease V [Pyrococcus kukulkanii]
MLEKIARIQEKLSEKVKEVKIGEVRTVAAVDVSYSDGSARAGFVVCTYPECRVLKTKVIEVEVYFPYIPTFFFLRETRPVLLSVRREKFDVLIVEGHGKAHPRKYGLASHIGLLIKKPTIGVAKKLLRDTPPETYRKVGRVYISVGNLITLEDAERIIKQILDETGYPKPLKLADKLSKGRVK